MTEPMAVDRSRWFVCPTLTPLYYVPSYAQLSPAQALRANQITALYFNELIIFFESRLAPAALHNAAAVAPELSEGIRQFLADEERHSAMFRRLNRRSAPEWYEDRAHHILSTARLADVGLHVLSARPTLFPVVFWIMLAMEEHSIEVSRRCLRVPKDRIDPQWAAVHRAHLEDEVRHVQMDRRLLETLYVPRGRALRRLNAALLRSVLRRFLLAPRHTGPRVVRLLVQEFPELAAQAEPMTRELEALDRSGDYVAMMYSRATTPLTFALFDRFPEMAAMSRALSTYQPPACAGEVA